MEFGAGGCAQPIIPLLVCLDGGAWCGFAGEDVGQWAGFADAAGEFEAVAEDFGVWCRSVFSLLASGWWFGSYRLGYLGSSGR